MSCMCKMYLGNKGYIILLYCIVKCVLKCDRKTLFTNEYAIQLWPPAMEAASQLVDN